ncbi:hypothetical protein, partial [Pseudomonas sp. MWU13-2105]|uniref:hypothetical protein n=1 Tax=Pseudomonas sp. MWU13-2105 TaxID=2935074 RepID=UPI00200E1824
QTSTRVWGDSALIISSPAFSGERLAYGYISDAQPDSAQTIRAAIPFLIILHFTLPNEYSSLAIQFCFFEDCLEWRFWVSVFQMTQKMNTIDCSPKVFADAP